MRPGRIEAAFLSACRAEIEAPKPGNVHRWAGGHGMDAAVFERAAEAAAATLCRPGARLGARVLGAVEASCEAVGVNANLGILLLCAPLAMAAESGGDLETGTARVLSGLDAEDARLVFAAIARAAPGGLGEARHDVREPPRIALREAMALAAPRDLVARQYANGFREVFALGLPALGDAPATAPWWPATTTFLAFAAAFPDSHVARKFGDAVADEVRARMARVRREIEGMPDDEALRPLLALDAALKAEGLNPGTSADLTVAALFAHRLGPSEGSPLRKLNADD